MEDQEFILNFQWEVSDIISVILLGVLFFWGVFLLYQKWIKNYDYPFWWDVLSLIGLFIILGIELLQLRDWLRNSPLLYILTGLGLFIFASALYSQSFVSLLTRLFLSVIHPGEESAPDVPRFGPAEVLERQNDWTGALNEYFVIARIYPHHPSVHLRIANAYIHLNQHENALNWLKKSLRYLKRDEDVYLIIARYCDIAQEIGDIKNANEMLEYYLTTYPDSSHSKSILERKERIRKNIAQKKSSLLMPLAEVPIDNSSKDEEKVDKKADLILEKIQVEEISGQSKEFEKDIVENKVVKDEDTHLPRLEPM